MKQVLFLGGFVAIAVLGLYHLINIYDANMKWGRMFDTPAIRPHEQPLLIMEAGIVPFDGGEEIYKAALADGSLLKPHLSTLVNGQKEYQSFCSHCHGNNLDGLGTVGQSFNPLPPDLTTQRIAEFSDNELFAHISYGGNRAPALATSMTVESRWAVIGYLRQKQRKN